MKNPQDATNRNVRAANTKIKALTARVRELERDVRSGQRSAIRMGLSLIKTTMAVAELQRTAVLTDLAPRKGRK